MNVSSNENTEPKRSATEDEINNSSSNPVLDADLKELSANFTQAALSFERDTQLSGLSETLNDCLTSTDEFQTLTDLLNADAQVSMCLDSRVYFLGAHAGRCPPWPDCELANDPS